MENQAKEIVEKFRNNTKGCATRDQVVEFLKSTPEFRLVRELRSAADENQTVVARRVIVDFGRGKVYVDVVLDLRSGELMVRTFDNTPVVVFKYSDAGKRFYNATMPEFFRFVSAERGEICPHKERYDRFKKSDGRISMDCADSVALYLREFIAVDHVIVAVSKFLDNVKWELPKDAVSGGWVDSPSDGWKTYMNNRYSHLNNGQRRMAAGTIFRSAVKAESKKTGVPVDVIIDHLSTY